ncbi:glycosyltransferase family 1 protein [Acidobacterium sp. S8]|uniref:glycosyltransferase family 4 protein n=1 Tax=Acidobacterium sp. S8 TaxID=1641854 RepID=UPI00131D8C07|nr:glycosyltransferase family 1 protein [Acidobacterium sp. S8]
MSLNPRILVNSRVLTLKSNGQKRVVEELIRRLPSLTPIAPPIKRASGLQGHIWEQLYLPLRAGKNPLWSPSTSGPIMHRNHVVTMHDLAFIDIPHYFSKSFARWYASMTSALARSVRHIVTVSNFTKKRVIERFGVDSDKVTAILLGVTPAFRTRSHEEITEALSLYGIGDQPYIVGFLGTDPRKNTIKLTEAWSQSSLAKEGARLVLFGRAANQSVFATGKLPENMNGIIIVGAIDDSSLAALYAGAQGFVFPSYYEGFGLPVVEAASCGCRIVTSNLSSLPEVSPSDAILLNPSDTHAIKDAIRHLFATPDTHQARISRIEEMKKFSWDRAATQYSRLFDEVLSA